MHCDRRSRLARALAAWVANLALASAALAQSYPSKPVHLVVPYAPGGAVDALARLVGAGLSAQLGQPFIIDDKPGASTNLGMQQVAKAAPDGYVLLVASVSLATNGALFANLPFDPAHDFAPVVKIGFAPLVIAVPAHAPWQSLQQLIADAKAHPGMLTYGSAGNGSSGHLAGELMKAAAAIDIVHVPYKGGAPAITDLIAERISFVPINPIEILPHVRAQKLRVLAVASRKRFAPLPDVPTAGETGLTGFEASVWWGFAAPAQTPPPIIDTLNSATRRIVEDPAMRAKLSELGVAADPGSPLQFRDFVAAETARWSKLIRGAGIRPD